MEYRDGQLSFMTAAFLTHAALEMTSRHSEKFTRAHGLKYDELRDIESLLVQNTGTTLLPSSPEPLRGAEDLWFPAASLCLIEYRTRATKRCTFTETSESEALQDQQNLMIR